MSVGIAQPTSWPGTDVVIVNYDIAHRFQAQLQQPWDLCILDEVQACKNGRSRRAQSFFGRPANRKTGEPAKPGVNARLRLALTGTPIENRPIEIQPVLAWLQPEQDRWKKWGFAKRYCASHYNGYGWDFTGASNLDELRKYLRQLVMVRRLKADVLKELPAKTRQVIELEATNGMGECVGREEAWLAENEDAIEQAQVALELAKAGSDDEFEKAVENLKMRFMVMFVEMASLRHDTAVAKVPAVIDWIQEELEETRKILVFVHHHDVGNAIHAAFQSNSVLVTGETPQDKAKAAVDRFQTDPNLNLFIGSIRATGEGITLTAANLVLFAELDWVPGKMCQCEDRAHRIGQRDNVLVKYLVVQNSLDAKVMHTLVEKMRVIDQALDRGEVLEWKDPVLPVKYEGGRKQKYRDEAAGITDEQIRVIHTALQVLAGMCDGAAKRDAHGFNKIDASIGHSLAGQPRLTPTQAALGRNILRKYGRQIGEETLRQCGL